MAPFYPVYPARSDGKLTTEQGKRKVKEPNRPTDDQLQTNQINGVYNFYKELKISDAKHIDWRRKLAGLLMKELHKTKKESGTLPASGPGSEANINPEDYMLVDFPENYRLYEHRRATSLESSGTRGPNDRRDVYLYGHPGGRKKRFRSPADFFPHLLWLLTTTETNHETCSCKLCTPDEYLKAAEEMLNQQDKLDNEGGEKVGSNDALPPQSKVPASETQPKVPTPKPNPASAKPPISGPPSQASLPAATLPAAVAPAVKMDPQAKVTTQTPQAPQVPQVPQAPQVPQVPVPVVNPRTPEQQVDQQVGKFVYRVGELAWYVSPGGNLALVAIVARSLYKNSGGNDKPAYVLQPLSHPFHHPIGTIITQEHTIKPWLAYSTPPYLIQDAGDDSVTYDQVNWEFLRARNFADQELIHDGSIRGAKMVDTSYTLFQPLSDNPNATNEIEYNGMYLGAEMVWTGEAIRLQSDDDCKDIMIVSKIIERSGRSPAEPAAVDVVGDVYIPASAAHNPNRPMPPNNYLPVRVREDLKFRNSYRIAKQNSVTYWKFVEGQKRVSISKVKGRWYESRNVLPALDMAGFQMHMDKGTIPDGASAFNGRGPAQNDELGKKVTNRLHAFSRAIPQGIQLGMHFQAPSGRASMPINLSVQASMALPEASMSDFVNMDSMEMDQNFIN